MKYCNFGNSGERIPLECSRELVCLAGGSGGVKSIVRKRKTNAHSAVCKTKKPRKQSGGVKQRGGKQKRNNKGGKPVKKVKASKKTKPRKTSKKVKARKVPKKAKARKVPKKAKARKARIVKNPRKSTKPGRKANF